MRQEHIVAACLLLFAAALLLFVANAPPADLTAPTSQHTDAPASAVEPAPTTTDASQQRSSVNGADGADGGAAAGPDPARIAITVVWPDGRPAAQAEVRYWPPRSAAQRSSDQAAVEASHDVEAALRATGQSALTDADGHVEVTADAEGTICARADDGYGELAATDRGSEHSWLVLRRDAWLRVEVVDDHGQPCAGITVDAETQFLSRGTGREIDHEFELPATDEQGRAGLPHVQVRAPLPDDDVVAWSLQLRCRGDHLVGTRRIVTAEELVAQLPIRLVVPSGGGVTVEVVDAAGEPCRRTPILVAESGMDCSPTRTEQANVFSFCQVPLGHRWRIVVEVETDRSDGGRPNHQTEIVDQELIGPTRVDEAVRARFVVPRIAWSLTARLRRADGRPFPWRSLRFQATAVGTDRTPVAIDAVPVHARASELELSLRLWTPVAGQLTDATLHLESDEAGADFDIPVPGAIRNRRQNLGDLVVPARADEMDLATVEVRIGGANATATANLRLSEEVRGQQRLVPTTRQQDGATSILRGARPAGVLSLECDHVDGVPARQRIEPGAHVVVELQAAARLCVRFAYGAAPDQQVSGHLVSLDDPGAGETEGHSAESSLVWDSMRPGRYRLVVAIQNNDVFAQELPPLVVGRNSWPAGAPLDLRSHAPVLHATVSTLTASGSPRSSGSWCRQAHSRWTSKQSFAGVSPVGSSSRTRRSTS